MTATGTSALNILFIGNSHTYYNDLPELVRRCALESKPDVRVAMLAHGGWFLDQHLCEPETRFNIRYGRYDYVVLQEHAHPFGPEERFRNAAVSLSAMIRDAGSRPVVYACWAAKNDPGAQAYMDAVHKQVADEIGALLAPVGAGWLEAQAAQPGVDYFAPDGRHASPEGSAFAARVLWDVIYGDIRRTGKP